MGIVRVATTLDIEETTRMIITTSTKGEAVEETAMITVMMPDSRQAAKAADTMPGEAIEGEEGTQRDKTTVRITKKVW